jgi:hypothetical protein
MFSLLVRRVLSADGPCSLSNRANASNGEVSTRGNPFPVMRPKTRNLHIPDRVTVIPLSGIPGLERKSG